MEDDASLDLWPLWVHSIDEYLDDILPKGWMATQLGSTCRHRADGMTKSGRWVSPVAKTGYGTFAFALSRRAIKTVYERFFRNGRVDFSELKRKCPALVADDCVFGFTPSRLSRWLPGGTKLLPEQSRAEPPFFAPLPIHGIHKADKSLCRVATLHRSQCGKYLESFHHRKLRDVLEGRFQSRRL